MFSVLFFHFITKCLKRTRKRGIVTVRTDVPYLKLPERFQRNLILEANNNLYVVWNNFIQIRDIHFFKLTRSSNRASSFKWLILHELDTRPETSNRQQLENETNTTWSNAKKYCVWHKHQIHSTTVHTFSSLFINRYVPVDRRKINNEGLRFQIFTAKWVYILIGVPKAVRESQARTMQNPEEHDMNLGLNACKVANNRTKWVI
jgi:hypothetical protein